MSREQTSSSEARANFERTLDQLFEVQSSAGRMQRALDGLRTTSQEWQQAIWYGQLGDSPVGPLLVAVGPRGLLAIQFGEDEVSFAERLAATHGVPVWPSTQRVAEAVEQLAAYLAGRRREFDLPVDLSSLTTFQRQVLKAAADVPAGVVQTYGQIARRIGRPRAARAVGQALARNPIPIVVPCHRVVSADGSLTGYSGGAGVETKAHLLALEGASLA